MLDPDPQSQSIRIYWFGPEFHWVSEFRFANKKEDKRKLQRKKVKIYVLKRGFV
jgi:hypothetical protein